ncbi:serine/threonine protein phosphatase 1 [compost metagenome]
MAGGQLRAIKNVCLWSRRRIELRDESGVADLVALVVGHTPLSAPARLGNVYYIDTGGWYPHEGGFFTLLDLHSLMPLTSSRDNP